MMQGALALQLQMARVADGARPDVQQLITKYMQ
jgi:hypothetical protein